VATATQSTHGGSAIDPMSQFELITTLGIFGRAVNFTQANLFMVAGTALVLAAIYYGMRPRAIVPGRLQALVETAYDGVMSMVDQQIGHGGRRFFPFVFALFFFVLMGNLLGLLPYAFTYTSHIAVTFGLAFMVFTIVTVVAIVLHGRKFLGYFFPESVPIALAPIIIPIEIISYLSRPVALSVRLFANMLAGHVMLKVFATFVVLMGGAGAIGVVGAIFPLAINIALIGFEILVAFLQAYVFAILTCIYLHDAVHLH
jgi:F-type H+-transporting ATPase subunit a